MLLNLLYIMRYRQTFYYYKNLIYLQDGSSIKITRPNKLNNLRLPLDNYNKTYLLKTDNKKKKNLKNTFLFFKKYSF